MASARLSVVKGHLLGCGKFGTVTENAVSSVQPMDSGDVNYQYTIDNNKLTLEQRHFYEENGFLVIKKLVAQKDLDIYRKRFEEICMKKFDVPGLIIMRDVSIAKSEFVPGEKAITKIQDFMNDPVMFEYCNLPQLLEYVESFTGPNIMAMHTMLINKPPDSGKKSSRHPMHQDLYYFPFRPADRIVCTWTAMQTVNRENGCLVVLPGSHKKELLVHGYPDWEGGVNKMYHGIKDYDPSHDRAHLLMEPGDTVFFHPLLIHGSGMNKTTGFRKSISCHFCTGDIEYIDIDDGHVQSVLSNEIRDLVSSRQNLDRDKIQLQMKDVWKYKGRLIKGEDNSKN